MSPTAETIADASYPLSRSLYIYPNVGIATEDETVSGFVDFYLTEEGFVTAVEEAGYIVLPADRQAASTSAWASAVS